MNLSREAYREPEGTRVAFWAEAFAIVVMCVLCSGGEMRLPLNHDVAWLLDAGSRWSRGERLYVDLIEVNPPLVFYLYWLITFGSWTKLAFITGYVTIIGVMGMWVRRLKGEWWGIASVVTVIAAGISDFGQRDHLAAVVVIPYLFASSAGPRERTLIGVWAFIGFGLKPHLLIIPAAATLGRMLQEKSIRPAFSPENLALGTLCLLYVLAVWIVYPIFFEKMIPLGNLVYFAYGAGLNSEAPVLHIVGFAAIVLAFSVRRKELWPIALAVVGAFISFFAQGRFWSYHLVPALVLTTLLTLMLVRPKFLPLLVVTGVVVALAEWINPIKHRRYPDLIPERATAVLFLSPHVGAAYPAVVDHGVRHASHYPAMWTLPGAWRLSKEPGTDPVVRHRALLVLRETREIVIGDIIRHCPDPIFVDIRPRKPYFKYPFDFEQFILSDPRVRDYRAADQQGMFRLYRREKPCPTAQQGDPPKTAP